MIFITKYYLLIRKGLPQEILYKNPLDTHYCCCLLGTFVSHHCLKISLAHYPPPFLKKLEYFDPTDIFLLI